MSPQVIFQIVLLFFVLVTIHEWGHYYFAKRAGILVREFAIGFGPKLFSFKRGETRYTLRLLPVGGFVRMAGEDPEIVNILPGQTIAVKLKDNQVTHIYLDQLDQRSNVVMGTVEKIDLDKELIIRFEDDGEGETFPVHPEAFMVTKGQETQIAPWNRQFGSKTVGQRSLAIFAGPVMNFILAFVLFVTVMFIAGVPTNVKIEKVEPQSPAMQAGIQSGDIIKSVNGTAIGTSTSKLTELIGNSADQKMDWIVLRGNNETRVEVIPTKNEETNRIMVGVGLSSDKRSTNFGEAFSGGWDNMQMATKQILLGFKMLVLGQFSLDDLGGPVRMVEVTSEHASAGLAQYTFWAAVLSLYLGIFNLLPIPALDGSRLVFLGFEALRGKPVDPNRESMVHFIGFAALMLLMLAVTYNDIVRLIRGEG